MFNKNKFVFQKHLDSIHKKWELYVITRIIHLLNDITYINKAFFMHSAQYNVKRILPLKQNNNLVLSCILSTYVLLHD